MRSRRIEARLWSSGIVVGLASLAMALPGCGKGKPAPVAPTAPAPAVRPPDKAATKPVTTAPGAPSIPPAAAVDEKLLAKGKELYAGNCAPCHGDTGNGAGLAARFLFPKPRNFREAKFRLVSTTNRIPSDDDLMYVLSRGMPGSAMFPFENLSQSDRQALVAYVRQLMRGGVEERFRKSADELGETVDLAELAQHIDRMTKPAATIELPPTWPVSGDESIARGRDLYLKQCAGCHGTTGKGDGAQEQRDDDGTPTSPRDYTRGIFKGGRDRERLYARIFLGMPGGPMPSSTNYSFEQIADMVHFIQALSDPSAQVKVQHQRAHLVAKRSKEKITIEGSASLWPQVPATGIVVSPLWWRNDVDPDLQVQAIHDGEVLAVRLSWRDTTRNERTIRPQEFSDKVAVQLFKGEPGVPEPFLGMGAAQNTVDMWLWEADWQADLVAFADVDTTYPDMLVEIYPLQEPCDDHEKHPTDKQPREFLTGMAAGNLRSDFDRGLAASGLQAKGFGTLTLLPRVSQVVTARGEWDNDRWTAVLIRPLAVSADTGIELGVGDKVSIALAIWDGAMRDRDGQKLVSIWHDLELEK